MEEQIRVIVSGGGTGGHIFPAISIANAIKNLCPNAKILFVGAEGRMEMQRVPAAGFDIKGLPVEGFNRAHLLKNISILCKLFKSRRMAKRIIKGFKPDVVVGVGGYASGPTLNMAARLHIPTLIQEQNSYAGVTNKLLAHSAKKICVAYEHMDRFFPKEKILMTGNPVRQSLMQCTLTRADTCRKLGFDPVRPTMLIVGGSLGARTINESVLLHLEEIASSHVQIIWQTGGYYFEKIKQQLQERGCPENLKVTDFIHHMDEAYRAADLIISRAGASSISELCLLGKPSILVPSPNVAEDHQTKNAMALVEKDAAIYIADTEAREKLMKEALSLVMDTTRLKELSANAQSMGIANSDIRIAEEVLKLIKKNK